MYLRLASALRIVFVCAITFTFGYMFVVLSITQMTDDRTIYNTNERIKLALMMAKDQVETSNRKIRLRIEHTKKLNLSPKHEKSFPVSEAIESLLPSANIELRLRAGPVRDVLKARPSYTDVIPPDSSCFFVDKLSGKSMPDIHSAFTDPIAGYIVFNGLKFLAERTDHLKYTVDFQDGTSKACNPVIKDKKNIGFMPQYIIVITCNMPDSHRFAERLTVTLRSSENNSYPNITICTSSVSNEKRQFLAMCTMVKSVDSFIPTWLEFHRFLGVEHVYIYDNEVPEVTTLPTTIEQFVKDGFVTIIPWCHSISAWKTYLEVQIAHENDCLWRHRHDVDWMIKIDVDEYIQPMDRNRTKIPDYLHDPGLRELAGIRMSNWFFGKPDKTSPEGDTVIQRNRWSAKEPTLQQTGHDKNIVRPINVHYYKIHNVKLGGEMISVDPYTELRLVHYRGENKRELHFELPPAHHRDDSMLKILRDVNWKASNITLKNEVTPTP